MVASGVTQRFDLFILTCLRIVVFMTRHNRQNPSGRVISPSQRPLPDNTQHSQQKNRQTSMPRVGFEPTISAGELPKTYALDRAAIGIGGYMLDRKKKLNEPEETEINGQSYENKEMCKYESYNND